MKIVRLQSNNVLRLIAVDILPNGNLITIGGRNGAGKSSVLNSIALALGGKEMAPPEPIHGDEAEAKIMVDLGDLIVTRRFSRDKNYQCNGGEDHSVHTDACQFVWGDTKSVLTVTNKEGAKYPSPQAMLDKLLGRLTFDPLAFSRDDPRRQDETLRKLVGLDVAPIDARRKTAFDARTMLKKTHEIKAAQLLALPHHEGLPEVELSLASVSNGMRVAEELRRAAAEADQAVDRAKVVVEQREAQCQKRYAAITEWQRLIAEAQTELTSLEAKYTEAAAAVVGLTAAAVMAKEAVPDVSVLQRQLAEVEATNVKIRQNAAHTIASSEVHGLAAEVNLRTQEIEAADADKRAALGATVFPVPGLGLGDEGVTLNGLPFSQASTSEQLRVSVAIGLALNPTLRVLLIRSGNLLDEDSLRAIAVQAEQADAQLWCEWVTKDASEVSVMIEDGQVRQ